MSVAIVSPASSYIRDSADLLAEALRAGGIDARVVPKLTGGNDHAHLGNSTRELLLPLAVRRRPTLVTLHDVVPRDPRLRAVLARPQALMLARHLVVVQSRHAAELAERLGMRDVRVVRHGVNEGRLPDARRDELRAELSPEGKPLLLMAGILKRARGSLAVLEAAASFPGAVFVLAGRPGDDETGRALAAAPGNVVHVDGPDDARFLELLASADVLLNFRLDSVGETSGPLVKAHAWGTPVAGWAVGSMPEYCGAHDLLFPPATPVREAIGAVLDALPGLGRVPLGDPIVTTWRQAAGAYAEMYSSLGWL